MESKRREAEEVVFDKKGIEGGNKGRGNTKWSVAYTNINGIISTLQELNKYIKEMQPDIMGITEVKLYEPVENLKIAEGGYNVWTKPRKIKKEEE